MSFLIDYSKHCSFDYRFSFLMDCTQVQVLKSPDKEIFTPLLGNNIVAGARICCWRMPRIGDSLATVAEIVYSVLNSDHSESRLFQASVLHGALLI